MPAFDMKYHRHYIINLLYCPITTEQNSCRDVVVRYNSHKTL